jgi:mannose-6-phosphate isomerase-like protein (cupin superfamily)
VKPDDAPLESLRRRLQKTEGQLEDQGYRTERATAHPGYQASNQIFGEETLILVHFGTLRAEWQEQAVSLGPGDHLHVPAGVPYQLSVEGETTAYWIQAHRKELDPERKGGLDTT